jgi:phosphoribosyl 1,2-cyclic phosphodiesterase
MKITFWGTRGSIASPGPETLIYGGNTTCLEVTLSSGGTVVIDSGTGIRRLGDALLKERKHLDLTLLITHIHWDHVVGFPFFEPVFDENCRIVVDGCGNGIDGIRHLFSNAHVDGTWPLKFEDLKARIEVTRELVEGRMLLHDAEIRSHPLQHPQGGVGFRFTEESGSFVFLTDNELTKDAWKGTSKKDFVDFCRDADLLIHDCQYLPEEMELRRGWGHSDVDSVAVLAMEAGVRRLVLFHHDPRRTDSDVSAMVDRCAEILDKAGAAVSVEGAREDAALKV